MEVIFEDSRITLYDDFAHHPTAIDTTLAGLREQVGAAPILAIIEPGSHTMRKGVHRLALKSSVRHADRVIWYRPVNVEWDMQAALAGPATDIEEDIDTIVDKTIRYVNEGAARRIVIMSNSGFGGLRARLTERLAPAG